MKVLVIGAAGRTGRHAVRMLLERGDNLTAFVRNPSAITERSDRLRVFHGDARDSAAINRAVQSQDAVLSARPEYIRASLDAIEASHGSVRRFVLDELQVEPAVLERLRRRMLD